MKTCRKQLHQFDGPQCPECYKTSKAAWYEANKEAKKASGRTYYETHKEQHKARVAAYQKANPAKVNAIAAKRVAKKLNATPKWLTKDHFKQIERYYVVAKWVQSIIDEPIEVDHIVPLQGEGVSGLHVPWNLQLLTKKANCSKGNGVK